MTDVPQVPPCPKCGEYHTGCFAHRKDGKACGRPVAADADVCRFHGGAAPQVVQARHDRAMRERITAALTSWDIPLDNVNPEQVLLDEVSRSARAVQFYGMLIAELNTPDPNDDGPLANVVGVDERGNPRRAAPATMLWGRDHDGDLGQHVLVQMWNDERRHLARVSKMAVDAGIAERSIALAENQAQQIVQIIVAVIGAPELGLDAEHQAIARTIAARELRLIEATSTPA